MNEYTSNEQENEIDLVSLFFAVAHKYKQMVAAAVVCAVLFGALGGVRYMMSQRAIAQAEANGEEVQRSSAEQQYEEDMVEYREAQTKHDTDVNDYKQQLSQNEADQVRAKFDIQNAQEYMDKSVLYKLDPYNVYMSETSYYITTDYKILPGMDYQNPDYTSAVLSAYSSLLTSHETIGAIAEDFGMEERYMRELISVSVDSGTRLLTISIKADSAANASAIMDAMIKRFEETYTTVESTVGSHQTTQVIRSDSTTVLTWLRDSQQDTRDNMTTLQNNLTNLESTHDLLEQNIATADADFAAVEKPEEVKQSTGIKKFALIGFLLGIVAVAGVAVVQFLLGDKVTSAEDVQRTCGIPALGTLANASSKKAKGFEHTLNTMEKRPDGSTDDQITHLIAATVHNQAPQAQSILLTGDVSAETLDALKKALEACTELAGCKLETSGSILKVSETVALAAKADVIVLAADSAVSSHASIHAQKAKIESFGKKILGCVMFA